MKENALEHGHLLFSMRIFLLNMSCDIDHSYGQGIPVVNSLYMYTLSGPLDSCLFALTYSTWILDHIMCLILAAVLNAVFLAIFVAPIIAPDINERLAKQFTALKTLGF